MLCGKISIIIFGEELMKEEIISPKHATSLHVPII